MPGQPDPAPYLSRGFRSFAGAIRPELLGVQATAAARSLRVAELSPHEFAFTEAALRLVLEPAADPAATLPAALPALMTEALAAVARAIGQPNNPGLARWLTACATHVATEADIPALLAHVQATSRHYAVIDALTEP